MKRLLSVLLFAALLAMFSTSQLAASSDIVGPSIIHKEVNQVFTKIDLLSLYDQDVFITEDLYTGNGNIPGEYSVTLSQGLSNKVVTVVVIENWGDLQNSNDVRFVTDLKNIYISNNRNLILYEMIYNIYANTGYVELSAGIRYEEIIDEYHVSFIDGSIPEGDYEFSFKLTYLNGQQASYQTFVNAKEFGELPGIVLTPPQSNFDIWLNRAPFIIIFIGVIAFGMSKITKKGWKNKW